MHFTSTFAVLGSFIAAALAQTSQYCDASSSICYQRYFDQDLGLTIGISVPETDSDEFIMQVVAPSSFGYTGVVFGESMMNNLMLVIWPNGNQVMVSPRMAADYANSPSVYDQDVSIQMLPGSAVNNSAITATFRCQGCTSWTGGSLDLDSSSATFGYAVNTAIKVNPVNSISGTLFVHNQQNFANMNLAAAKTSSYASQVKRSFIRG